MSFPPLATVMATPNGTTGTLTWQGGTTTCAIGKGGLADPPSTKREGDGKTPVGTYRLTTLYYRADRVERPITGLPLRIVQPDDLWCDDQDHPMYNRPVAAPFAASAEKMWRTDHAYDLCAVLDYNLFPAIAGAGSAIFVHLPAAQGGELTPTEGCIRIDEATFRALIQSAQFGSLIEIAARPG